jgi:type III restriction enzyme
MPTFPKNPFTILDPSIRWVPAVTGDDLFNTAQETLLPPMVHKIRTEVKEWRERNYEGASVTSKQLLQFWFNTPHQAAENEFRFYFAQQEAIESIIYLYEVAKARDKYELIKYDSLGRVSPGMFDETWTRYVIKMATGSGKTKVIALALVWSYFHKLYENNSQLSKNFLVIAPNIIVLNRLRKDFDYLKIFKTEPLIPDNGMFDRDWKNDFQLTLHIQDDVKPITEDGNFFLTNIHRVYLNEEKEPTLDEEFLGTKPSPDADTNRGIDLGKILRSDKIKDIVVFNDEAHHIHDPEMQWFKSIQDINNQLKLKTQHGLGIQVDFTATPKHNDGSIFVQTICDYPLVEAIRQNIVKTPVLPDGPSRAKLEEKPSDKFTERYREYIHLGYIEWEKQYENLKSRKTPVLFVMTTTTAEANETKSFLEMNYPKLKDAVLIIHTNKKGDVNENATTKAAKTELDILRQAADAVDSDTSPYKAVVSVLMLREGWDVRNVSTIVGLRPFGAESKILPEQTIGRGLRKMFPEQMDFKEELVVLGTEAFIDFVESIKTEGVELGYRAMGKGTPSGTPLIVEVDNENTKKNLDELDIKLPVLSPRIYREFKNLEDIDEAALKVKPTAFKTFSADQLKEIVFVDIDGYEAHKTIFKDIIPDYRNVVGFFAKSILRQSGLFGGFNILFPKVEQFISQKLFDKTVDLNNPQTIRNLSEPDVKEKIFTTFKEAIDQLTIKDKGSAQIKQFIQLRKARPIVVKNQGFIKAKKSVFNKVIADNDFELDVAGFLEDADIISFAKNFLQLNFKIEYQGEDGNIHDFHPDFIAKKTEKEIFIIETKGREDLDDIRKIKRLVVWCSDVNSEQSEVKYIPLYIEEDIWKRERNSIKTFEQAVKLFTIKPKLL